MGLTVTLDMIIFTEDIDPKIRRVWEELKALDSQHSENAI